MRSSRRLAGPLLVAAVVLAVALAVALLVAGALAGREEPAPAAAAPRAAPVGDLPAVSVEARALARWDARRARAYARGDVPGLRALYAPGSAAADRDVALLRSYVSRGLRVRGLRMQLLALDVQEHRPDRVRLRVTDRVVGARAVARGWSRRLPADQPTTRVVTMTRKGGSWRVASVSGPGRP